MEKDLKSILEISYPYCKNSDEAIAGFFRNINSSAYKALKHVERSTKKGTHWTEQHHKNYHMG